MRIKAIYTMTAPVSHIGEVASTGSYFQTIQTSIGRVPAITGNSVRGILRDNIALRFCELTGAKLDKEIFHIFFSGGNLNGAMHDDVGKARQVREHFPGLSLLGGGLGDMILAGKSTFSFLIPVCRETEVMTGILSDVSWHGLIDEIEFTRTDDSKNDELARHIEDMEAEKQAKASTQMRFQVQYMAPGTQFVQTINLFENATELEIGAFWSGMKRWFGLPRLGGMSARGFGSFDAVVGDDVLTVKDGQVSCKPEIQALIEDYERFVVLDGDAYLSVLLTGKKEAKNRGKAAN